MGCDASVFAKPGTQGRSFCAVPRWSTVTVMLSRARPGGWVAQKKPKHWKHLTSPLLILKERGPKSAARVPMGSREDSQDEGSGSHYLGHAQAERASLQSACCGRFAALATDDTESIGHDRKTEKTFAHHVAGP